MGGCCSNPPPISDEATDFVRFAQTIKLMPSKDDLEVYDYGMTIAFAPSASRKHSIRKQTRFKVVFDKRKGFQTTLIHTKAGVWRFQPPLPDIDEDEQQDGSIYTLLDNLMREGWVHAPHLRQTLWTFTGIRQHVKQHGFKMNRQLYGQLFPQMPKEEEEVIIPSSMVTSSAVEEQAKIAAN
jgi:hypothetical protein